MTPLRTIASWLVFSAVAEPYAAFNGRAYRLLRVVVEPKSRLVAKSKMQDGCLFLDGPYRQVGVRLGDEVTFSPLRNRSPCLD